MCRKTAPLVSSQIDDLSTVMISRARKYLLYVTGLFFLGLGIAGYVLPGLPGTIFLIIAASCFLRSNQRMYRWVTGHRLFGKLIRNYIEKGVMPVRAKVVSVLFIWVFTGVSLWVPEYGLLFKVPMFFLAAIGTWYIVSRASN